MPNSIVETVVVNTILNNMDSLTNICRMLSGNNIYVPNYQRAYSWDTEFDLGKTARQVNTFLIDLQDYIESKSASRYYFGHFLFEEKSETLFGIIDGQQRLTTISIFIAALFRRLKELRNLTDEEDFAYKSMIKVGQTYHFSTVDYDNQLFRDYVINQIKNDHNGLDTKSKQRIVAAFDFFTREFSQMEEAQITSLLNAVMNASCTTHIVKNEAEAIQMFIFQNNRGKTPSNLEIIKAQFLYNVHLYGGAEDEKADLIDEIKNRFEEIYKSISKIEHKINEDNVLSVLKKFPTITKQTIIDNKWNIFSDEVPHDFKYWRETGGSTGVPLKYPSLASSYYIEDVCQMMLYHMMGFFWGDTVVYFGGDRVSEEKINKNEYWFKSKNLPYGKYIYWDKK